MARTTIRTEDVTAGAISATDIASNSITATQIAANAIGNSEMADDAVGINELSATGTASATTFLRGDNAWASAAAGFHNVQFITATDTTVDLTSGTTLIVVEVQGAGGAAAGSNGPGAYGGCGAAGGYSMQKLTVVDTDTWNVTIGAGGTDAGTKPGGDAVFAQASGSSLGSTITAGGGGGGTDPPGGSGSHQNGGSGGTVTNTNAGAFNITGSDGASGGLDKQGANSRWGQGGIRRVAGSGAGGNATGYGAGGGDPNGASQAGGSGSGALVVIWEYK